MNVQEVMRGSVRSVRMADRLDAAARLMWEQDCGIAPVVDSSNVLVGVVTDRDLCMATYTQGRVLAEIPVTAVMARMLRTCRAEDSLDTALQTLQQAQLHRLPVVDGRGVLVGMLSCNDLIRLAATRPAALDPKKLVAALAAIGALRQPAATVVPAAAPGPVAGPRSPAQKPVTVVAAASSAPAPAPVAASSLPPVAVAKAPSVIPTSGKDDAGKDRAGKDSAGKPSKNGKAGKGKKG
ncbi:MAG: CBS domain-containing protein [Planctomycetes bacterium]|nr:CBS domain-containing protein [Planctomycetota bacterium]